MSVKFKVVVNPWPWNPVVLSRHATVQFLAVVEIVDYDGRHADLCLSGCREEVVRS